MVVGPTSLNPSMKEANIVSNKLAMARLTFISQSFTTQVLNICRTPGPTAYLRKVYKVKFHCRLEPVAIQFIL